MKQLTRWVITILFTSMIGVLYWYLSMPGLGLEPAVAIGEKIQRTIFTLTVGVIVLMATITPFIFTNSETRKQNLYRRFVHRQASIETGIWEYSTDQYLVCFSEDTKQYIDQPSLAAAQQHVETKNRYRSFVENNLPLEPGIWFPEAGVYVVHWEQDTDIQIWNDLESARRAFQISVRANWSQEKALIFLKSYPIVLVLSSIFIALNYWKPSVWWNSVGTVTFRHTVGEQAANFFGYALPFILLSAFTGFAIKAIRKVGLRALLTVQNNQAGN